MLLLWPTGSAKRVSWDVETLSARKKKKAVGLTTLFLNPATISVSTAVKGRFIKT
jgi:hypothetical protein